MAKYKVTLRAYAFTSVEVEADDPDEAVDKAYDAGTPTLCAQCSGWGQDTSLELNEVWEATDVYDAGGKVVWAMDAKTDGA